MPDYSVTVRRADFTLPPYYVIKYGTADADLMAGTASADHLYGLEGSDTISGLGGDDHLNGGYGNDRLDGGEGDDTLTDDLGANVLAGGLGNDRLYSTSSGASVIDGGAGDDTLLGGHGDDILEGGAGADLLIIDTARLYPGRPTPGANIVRADGGAGDDFFEVILSPSRISHVQLTGGPGIDTFGAAQSASPGSIVITDFVPGAGGDKVNLTNHDLFNWDGDNPFGALQLFRIEQRGAHAVVQFDQDGTGSAGQFTDLLILAGVNASLLTAANFTGALPPDGSSLASTLLGTPGSDELRGGYGHDTIYGAAGDDTLHGMFGNDFLDGGDGDDKVYGDRGNNTLHGGSGDDYLGGESGNDTLDGGAGDDTLESGLGDDLLTGGDGNDMLRGSLGNDVLDGGADNDVLDGGAGDDRLDGGAGHDALGDYAGDNTLSGGDGNDNLYSFSPGRNLLSGGAGDDTITGGAGWDVLDGGAGNDTLAFNDGNRFPLAAPGHVVTLDGGAGADILSMQGFNSGNATVTARGGAGADTFTVMQYVGKTPFTALDFQSGTHGDMVSVAYFYQVPSGHELASKGNPFDSGELRLLQVGADTHVQFGLSQLHTMLVLANVDARSLTIDNFAEGISPAGGMQGIERTGDAGINHLAGGLVNDTLWGMDGPDWLSGYSGADTLAGGGGDDRLEGGAGIDLAVYSGKQSDYSVSRSAIGFDVTALRGDDGADTLEGIERLAFGDSNTRIALDSEGAAGQVYRLYQAAFDRAPDQGGLGFWIAQSDRGMGLNVLTANFVSAPEFTALYGAAPTNADIVGRFYQNILHRAPDPAGFAFWNDVLDRKAITVPDLLAQFSESAENKAALDTVIGQGFPYTFYDV